MVHLSLAYFDGLLALSQILAFTFVIFTGFFYNRLDAGFRWDLTGTKFNYGNMNLHGMFMGAGMVFLQGEAILAFRMYRNEAKLLSKCIHAGLHCLALAMAGTGLYTIINHKDINAPTSHFTSVHSWIGVALLGAYIVQLFFGLLNFGLGFMPMKIRASFLPLHRVFGLVIFSVTAAQAVLGSIGYANFAVAKPDFSCYKTWSCESHLDAIFTAGVLSIVLYAITVVVLATPSFWKRQKTPDEEE